MFGVLAFFGLAGIMALAFIVGRKSKPFELEEEVAPGVKPFVPSEEMGVFGYRPVRAEDILPQDIPPLDIPEDPESEE